MNSLQSLEMRRAVVAMWVGDTVSLSFKGVTPGDTLRAAIAFARAKARPIEATIDGGVVRVRRVAEWPNESMYRHIDALQVGESHLFDCPPSEHQLIRVAASHRNRQGNVLLTCNVEGQRLRVTRMPLTANEVAAHGPARTGRVGKYDLDRLASQRELKFDIDATEHRRLRVAVSQKAQAMGWTVRCHAQKDGSMLVYRIDATQAAS